MGGCCHQYQHVVSGGHVRGGCRRRVMQPHKTRPTCCTFECEKATHNTAHTYTTHSNPLGKPSQRQVTSLPTHHTQRDQTRTTNCGKAGQKESNSCGPAKPSPGHPSSWPLHSLGCHTARQGRQDPSSSCQGHTGRLHSPHAASSRLAHKAQAPQACLL